MYPLPMSGEKGLQRMIIEFFLIDRFGLESPRDLYQRKARGWASVARYAFFYLLNRHLGLSLKEIGRHFGLDHTTVIYGIEKIKEMGIEKELERQLSQYTPPAYLCIRRGLFTKLGHTLLA